MATFPEVATQLHEAQRSRRNAAHALHEATERSKKVEDALARFERTFDARDPASRERRQQLEAELDARKGRRERLDSALRQAAAEETRIKGVFEQYTDPRKTIAHKDASLPFLLFPLRIETRWKKIAAENRVLDELWVRAYPDDCLVDTFEATLSEGELNSLDRFWINWARAGGDENQQRGAWRSLVAGFGSGRAAWLVEQYRPTHLDQLPVKAAPEDIVLVVASFPALDGARRNDAATYWATVWSAADDAAAIDDARTELENALGDAARAAEIIDRHKPKNLDENPAFPLKRADVDVQVAFLEIPDRASIASQRQSWARAPRTFLLPERLVLQAYRGNAKVLEAIGNVIPPELETGPDPLADAADQFRIEQGDVVFSPGTRWMVDFDEAVRVGMAFRLTVTPADVENGFDRLLVLGVRLSADEAAGKDLVEQLLLNHQRGSAGFAIVPQGTPTNNTEAVSSGHSDSEDSDESFDLVFGQTPPLTPAADPNERSDAQWLADTLGIDLQVLEQTSNARGRDQSEARALNTVLWPGTWGYFLETMLKPVLNDDAITGVRWFFTNFVQARGTTPAIRIGAQPYGVLPATVMSRMAWLQDDEWRPPAGFPQPENFRTLLARLNAVLALVRQDWVNMAANVSFVGKSGDPHQILFDVVGMTPASVEFYHRYAESLEELSNRLNFQGFGGDFVLALISLAYTGSGSALLTRLGYTGNQIPEVLEKFFLQDAAKLEGDIIDDRKLSEHDPVREYTADHRNYIRWLIDAARTSFDTLRQEDGFIDDKPPTALLYLLLRYVLQQGYWDAGLRLFEGAGVLSPAEATVARIDASFIHVADREAPRSSVPAADERLVTSGKPVRLDRRSESRYEYLYRAEQAITGNATQLVAEFIPGVLGGHPATRFLDEQLAALERLVQTPTARLERLLAEHLDLCTYRQDAWRWGMVHYALASLRYGSARSENVIEPRRGVYVGAFGWLEQVRSEKKVLTPVQLPPELDSAFNSKQEAPLMIDSTNAGYVHAPSVNHALAAAVLRNGYISNATPQSPNALAVHLSSARVRRALGVIDGIRNGQSLGALLGYQLERGLHDRHNLAEVDEFIFKLRRAFPLVADHLKDTQPGAGEAIEAIEARNVVDGLALVEHIATTGNATYPFGKDLPPATPAQSAVINAEVDRIRDLHDAVADLATAETVYQAVQGNHGRAGATLQAYAQGTFPPAPEVAQSPRTGTTLTHRLGLQLEPGLDGTLSPNAVGPTPRSRAEPALNSWLNGVLPAPDEIVCGVHYFDPVANGIAQFDLSVAALDLQPLDLLYLLSTEVEQAMADFDDRVVDHVMTTRALRPDVDVRLDYTTPVNAKFTMLETGALLRSLRTLLLKSRPLTAGDISLPNETTSSAAGDLFVDPARLTGPITLLAEFTYNVAGDDVTELLQDMDALLADPAANRAQIVAAIDGWSDRFLALARKAVAFGIPAGTGFIYAWRKQRFQVLLARVRDKTAVWQERLQQYATLVASLPGLPDDDARFTALRQAESKVAMTYTAPRPATVAAYLTATDAKRDLFDAKRLALEALLDTNRTAVNALIGDIDLELPIDAFDVEPLQIEDQRDELARFARDVRAAAELLRAEATSRRDRAQAAITAANNAANAQAAAQARVDAAHALFGDEFVLIPEFGLSAEGAEELRNAWNDRSMLLTYLIDPKPAGQERDFPVYDWLHGVARVREKFAAWENAVMLSSAFGTSEPQLEPIQLPYRPDDRWLALPFPNTTNLEGERLLYTAHHTVPFDHTMRQCGLLLDDWTEVIPGKEETTGITFHYDRPNSEPPQVLLLAVSPALKGGWQWNDLIDTMHEMLDEAKLRAVEPVHVDASAYGRFLPAAIMAATHHEITIGLNLALNNKVMTVMTEAPHG
jgi:hypothetical protein